MSAALPFINQRLDDARKPIDADLFLWLSGRKHPNLGFSGSLAETYWGPYLDGHARQLTDLAFAAAKDLAAEYGLDPYDTVEDAWNGAESAVQQVIDRMQDYDRKMRGKGFPGSVPMKNVLDIRERHSKAIRKRAENERDLRRLSSRIGTNIFIGHGRSKLWEHLKDFVQNTLHLPCDEFNRVPVAGVTNTARLSEMLDQAAFAFLIMTAEDEQADGKYHARMNVVHEAGLFQARLGFQRAILLLEEGCEAFSNADGLGRIQFPRGEIDKAFEEIRRVLEREELIPPAT